MTLLHSYWKFWKALIASTSGFKLKLFVRLAKFAGAELSKDCQTPEICQDRING